MAEDSDKELGMCCWTDKQFWERLEKEAWSWVRHFWAWAQVNSKKRRMFHLLNHSEVAQLPEKVVTMELMGIFTNWLGLRFNTRFYWTIFSTALMETCGGVRGCDSLHNSCWRKLQDNVSEEDGVKLERCATTELRKQQCSHGGKQAVLLGKQMNHSVLGELCDFWYLLIHLP